MLTIDEKEAEVALEAILFILTSRHLANALHKKARISTKDYLKLAFRIVKTFPEYKEMYKHVLEDLK